MKNSGQYNVKDFKEEESIEKESKCKLIFCLRNGLIEHDKQDLCSIYRPLAEKP